MSEPVTVQDFMTRDVITFDPDMDVLEAARVLVEKGISGAPVMDRLGNLVGVLSEKDCLKIALSAGYHSEWGGRVAEYMHPEVATMNAETSIVDAARRFMEVRYRRFPVLKDERLVGVISRRDVLRALSTLW
jgi:CBS domain-containing protein